jgi:hypothetical protein
MSFYRRKSSNVNKDQFSKDENGWEVYRKDGLNNELYPDEDEMTGRLFARNHRGERYYARDRFGNEFYPVRKKKSITIIDPVTKLCKLAYNADGSQRYPFDHSGNEYYLRDEDGKPFLLRDVNGDPYLAKSRHGKDMIPWNFTGAFMKDQPYSYRKDSIGNSVYMGCEDLSSPMWQTVMRWLCRNIHVMCEKGCI